MIFQALLKIFKNNKNEKQSINQGSHKKIVSFFYNNFIIKILYLEIRKVLKISVLCHKFLVSLANKISKKNYIYLL